MADSSLGTGWHRANGKRLLELIADVDERLDQGPREVRAALADLDRALRLVEAERRRVSGPPSRQTPA